MKSLWNEKIALSQIHISIFHNDSQKYLRLVMPVAGVTFGNCVEMSFVIGVDPGKPVAGIEVKKSRLIQQ